MINYEDMPTSFHMLKVKYVSRKHWSDSLGWGMVEVMHDVLLEAIRASLFMPTSLLLVQMKLQPLTTHNGFQFIYMWCKVGRRFQSFYMLNLLGFLPQ
jgi:hypothetical protein